LTETDRSGTFRIVIVSQGQRPALKRVALKAPRTPNHRLRDLRRNRGWSYAKLGYEAGGITAKTIRDIEEGWTRNPRIRTMHALAEALRVKVTDLDADVVSRGLA
jgi:DNA-binding XRE family transcriptional regulator